MSHSKRNTSRSIFTSHERALARVAWGSNSARLSRESFLPFGSCSLCLETAVNPVCCPHGDVFCRECALANILAQKREIRRAGRARDDEAAREEREREGMEEEARRRAVREFELVQVGLEGRGERWEEERRRRGGNKSDREMSARGGETNHHEEEKAEKTGEKRKFKFDEDEVVRIAEEERAKARKALDAEKEASKTSMPSFWVPSVTPSSSKHDPNLHAVRAKTKTQPLCPAAPDAEPHPYSLHALITAHFTEEDVDEKGASRGDKKKERVCPACKKVLSNSLKAMLAKPCGHVLCKPCVGKFMKPAAKGDHHHDDGGGPEDEGTVRCFVCEEDVTERPDKEAAAGEAKKDKKKRKEDKIRPGLVELRSEGTGFSAGGVNQVKKHGVNFQC